MNDPVEHQGTSPIGLDRFEDSEARNSFVRALLDAMPDGLIVLDPKRIIRAASPAACAMFGYGEDELLGNSITILMISEDVEEFGNSARTVLRSSEIKAIRAMRIERGRHKSGRILHIKHSINEAVVDGQRIVFCFIEDMTEADEQRRKFRDLSSQLAHASRIMSVSTLAGAIAHELNQPLTAIRNYVDTVEDIARKDDPIDHQMLRESMSACSQEASRAGEIIRRLREFIVRRDTAFTIESLSQLVNTALALALVDGEKSGVVVRLRLDEGGDAVMVDSIEVQQVIFNLVRNALQAMAGMGQKVVVIRSRADDEMVEVTVEDSGPGLDPEREAQLILPFTSGGRGALGLGLQICQTIIEMHGGRIWSTPSALGGAAIHFTIPRMLEDERSQ